MEGVLGLHHAACMKLRQEKIFHFLMVTACIYIQGDEKPTLKWSFLNKNRREGYFFLPEIVRFRPKAAYGGTRISMWQDIFHRHRRDLTNSEWLYPFYRTNLS